jgi:ABC-type glutathione transport system ATPase component
VTTIDPIMEVDHLVCQYRVQKGFRTQTVHAIADVSIQILRGELLAVVGESGSGKSTLGRALARLMKPVSGRVLFEGSDTASLRRSRLAAFRSNVQIVLQNPYQSLNPRLTIDSALAEVLHVWSGRRSGSEDIRVPDLLEMVHLPANYARKYPHELSGGERQRIAIARAMAVRPRVLVADEPVSALDVSAAARILNLLLELRQRAEFTCVFITHDLGLARSVADRIAVMHGGSIVETGVPGDIFERPSDDYTRTLIGAQLHIRTAREGEDW